MVKCIAQEHNGQGLNPDRELNPETSGLKHETTAPVNIKSFSTFRGAHFSKLVDVLP